MAEGHNGGPLLVGTTTTLLFLATISVAARCYNQIVLMKRFQIEDWLAVVTWFVFALFTGICCTGVHYGLGKSVEDVPMKNRPKALFFKYLGMTTYVAASGLIKFVVGLYLVKLFSASRQKWQTRFLWTLLAIVGVVNTAYFFISIFQCNPIERFWMQNDPDWPKRGRCLKTWLALASTYTVNIVNIIADVALALLPISLVWNSKMDKRTKWSVVAILSIGSAASICTIIRVPFVYQLLANKEYLANFIDLGVWSAVEIGLAIVASSAATLRPLFRKLKLLQTTIVHRSRKSGHSRSRSFQIFPKDRKNSMGNALGQNDAAPKSTSSKGLSSFGGSTFGTDTKISFSQALGNKKSYATLEGDTLNDPSDDIANGGNPKHKRRSSPIHVRTSIFVDVEKGEGGDGDIVSPTMHPRYHPPFQSSTSEHRRTDSEERSMWGKRESQAHQYHIPHTHQRSKTRDHELADLEEVSNDGGGRTHERLLSPRTPRSPFPMISPTSSRSPASPLLSSNMPSPYSPSFSLTSPKVNNNNNNNNNNNGTPSPYSPHFPPPLASPTLETQVELQQPQPTHQPAAKPQGSLLPVPPVRESETRRLSSPM
ncbi:hypothetical protein PpBr36_04021 [Pyricularia pennisetigena]|uniref:hypothetical protein n=1 Tax=Pyricularia pennisetigena TaxID=1578925 RepID=UPI00114FB144|nr:hypothetical protein PpBr36_04021 [Pyricularia pennisetigena]TLS26498.1 hypothetical protein PpBr36_04021 [Pyricularia pennisetigena]